MRGARETCEMSEQGRASGYQKRGAAWAAHVLCYDRASWTLFFFHLPSPFPSSPRYSWTVRPSPLSINMP